MRRLPNKTLRLHTWVFNSRLKMHYWVWHQNFAKKREYTSVLLLRRKPECFWVIHLAKRAPNISKRDVSEIPNIYNCVSVIKFQTRISELVLVYSRILEEFWCRNNLCKKNLEMKNHLLRWRILLERLLKYRMSRKNNYICRA